MLKAWTIGRASGVGTVAGLIALILWPIYAKVQAPAYWPFVGALAVTGFCGLSVLLITAGDLIRRKRGRALRPVRGFDIAFGLLLAAPSLMALESLLG